MDRQALDSLISEHQELSTFASNIWELVQNLDYDSNGAKFALEHLMHELNNKIESIHLTYFNEREKEQLLAQAAQKATVSPIGKKDK